MIAKIYPDNHPDLQEKRDPTHPVRYFDIRKLTEGECLRLMDVPDVDIVKLCQNKELSKSAIYKLAGNSIVVSCLYNIFRNIWLTEDEPSEERTFFPEPTFRAPLPDKIRLVTLCSGYDSQAIAMQRLIETANRGGRGQNTTYELMAWAEYDPEKPKTPLAKQPAVIAHNTLFPQWKDRNLGDMTKIDWKAFHTSLLERGEADIDLLTYSTPCQSISQAGKREGLKKDSGTRSSILWYTEEAIRVLRPKFLLQENVKALVNKFNIDDFKQWQNVCSDCGYENYYAVLNAKDYGVPQNRERVFMLSVRKDLDMPTYRFPKGFKLMKCIADVLDEDVDSSYFLKPEAVINFLKKNETDATAEIYYTVTDHKLTNEEIVAIRKSGGSQK